MASFTIERTLADGSPANLEVEASYGVQANDSSRVTFFDSEDKCVASFINIQAWYPTPAAE